MKNFLSKGDAITFTAPAGGVVSGQAYLIGGLVVLATITAAAGLPFPGVLEGVADVPKVADEAWTEGAKVYWDDSAKVFTTVSSGNTLVGSVVGGALVPLVVTLATNGGAALTIAGLVATIVTFGALGGKTVTVTINGVAHVLTEGADWTAATGNNEAATSLAAAIDALVGVDAAAVSAAVTAVPSTGIASGSAATGRVRLDGVAR